MGKLHTSPTLISGFSKLFDGTSVPFPIPIMLLSQTHLTRTCRAAGARVASVPLRINSLPKRSSTIVQAGKVCGLRAARGNGGPSMLSNSSSCNPS